MGFEEESENKSVKFDHRGKTSRDDRTETEEQISNESTGKGLWSSNSGARDQQFSFFMFLYLLCL